MKAGTWQGNGWPDFRKDMCIMEKIMEMYEDFAQVYDRFMDETPYEAWADFVEKKLKEAGIEGGLVPVSYTHLDRVDRPDMPGAG